MDQLKFIRVDEEHRYVAMLNGQAVGHVRYRTTPGHIVLIHAEVSSEFEGGGVGSALARGALDDIRARGMKAVPRCPFIASYVDRHPEYADLVDDPPTQ